MNSPAVFLDEADWRYFLKTLGKAAGLGVADWERLSGADARKVAVADVIWGRTTVSQKWIGEKLRMSSAANVTQQIRRWKTNPQPRKLPAPLWKYLSEYDT